MSVSAKDLPYGSVSSFLGLFEELRSFIINTVVPKYKLPEDAVKRIDDVMTYNVPGGKLNRGLTVVHALYSISGNSMTEADAKLAAVLGWCIEWLQAFFLVADDIMDASITRRGQPCWYKKDGNGMIAINDSFLLQANIFSILKEYFGAKPYYLQLIELFNEVTWQTELGQLLDLTSQPTDGSIDLDRFSLSRYRQIVEYKTAYYSFFLPVACALTVSGLNTPEALETSRNILIPMGEYFQIQDDYLDCYAPPEVIGKIGTDIQDNKCSWLVCQALQRASPEQIQVLKANYAKKDDNCVAIVKQLYRDLKLEELFLAYEEQCHNELKKQISEEAPKVGVPVNVYNDLLAKIFKRSK